MSATRAGVIGRLALSSLGLALGFAGPVLGQGHTPDPYNIVGEYNSQYEPYLYAAEPTDEGVVPNQNRANGRASAVRGANGFQNYLDELDGREEAAPSARNPRPRNSYGVPFFRAHREADPKAGPNREADKGYYDNQRRRSQEYFDAVRETDPKKRAQLFRDLNQQSLRASRNLPDSRAGVSRRGVDPFGAEADAAGPDAGDRGTPRAGAPRNSPRSTAAGAGAAPMPPRSSAPRPLTTGLDDVLERSRRMDRAPRSLAPGATRPGVRRPSVAPR